MLTVHEVLARKDPRWLIRYILPEKSLSMVWGPSNIGKTFVTLDLACSVASGEPFLDHEVPRPARVVYVAGEGIYGFKKRVGAWLEARELPPSALDNLLFREKPVKLRDGVETFLTELQEYNPALVVIDTLASSNLGGDEDSAEGMGPLLDSILKLRKLPTAVMLVHHSGWDAKHERGSSALRGAMDLSVEVRGEPGWHKDRKLLCRSLICWKQRDYETFLPIHLRLRPVTFTLRDRPQASLVPYVVR